MIFPSQPRNHRTVVIIVGALVFVAVFIGLAYNHFDTFEVPTRHEGPDSTSEADNQRYFDQIRQTFLKDIYKPSIKPDTVAYKPFGAFEYKLNEEKISWREPLKEKLCIIDLDSRGFDQPGQIFGPDLMSWDNGTAVHGLSLGVLQHWLYAKIHGYKYYYIEIGQFEDRRDSWKKPPIMKEILKDHDTCLYLDSDAIFHHLDLPFEWLMNFWDIRHDNNSLALALDPGSDNNKDKFGKVYLNTGFIVAQSNPKTNEIMDAWEACPDEGGKHPDCVEFRTNGPGRPTDQGGFGTFIRYDFPEDIKELLCTEANGFPEARSGCDGKFIKHLWTGKKDWIKIAIGEQIPGKYLEIFHEQYLKEKDSFYFTEEELMAGKTHKQ